MFSEYVQNIIIVLVFLAVIVAIALDVIDMLLAALLGVSFLTVLGIFNQHDILNVTRSAGGPIALLFGGMVVARVLTPTGIFEYIGSRYVIFTRGSGKRFLLSLFLLVGPLCTILPNATTVILLAPIILRVAQTLKVDLAGPMIITAIISNSAGLLTLVGDPATFLVGSAIGMSFMAYLQKVSLGGLLTLLVLVPLVPLLMREIWQTEVPLPADLKPEPLTRPYLCLFALLILGIMVILFITGEMLPSPIVPPAVSIIAASLALLLVYEAKVDHVTDVLKDVDWRTLLFLIALFCLVEAFAKTGLLQGMSGVLYTWFGTNLLPISLFLLAFVGLSSSVLANIPVVAIMLLMVKGYLVSAQFVPETGLAASFLDWPTATLPVFIAMMFAGTLGGNATLIGASANVVAAGICAAQGQPISFMTFLRYGAPLMVCQLVAAALYILIWYTVSG